MEIIYTDISIIDDLLYKINKSNAYYNVIISKLSTDDIVNSNAYNGSIEDCIAFITTKINK